MKDFRLIALIATILATGSAIDLSAQARPENTSAARAAYGVMPDPAKYKTKKKHKTHRNKQAKLEWQKNTAYRRRSNWAN